MPDALLGSEGSICRLDPRVKIVSSLAFVLFIILTPPTRILHFAMFLVIIGALIALAKLPLLFVLRRSLVVVPFVLLVALLVPFLKEGEIAGGWSLGPFRLTVSTSGLWILWNVCIKAWSSVLIVIVLTSTTGISGLLQGLQGLKVPKVLVVLLAFLLRYFPLVADQVMALRRAGEARGVDRRPRSERLGVLGRLLGTLFIRTYERGERVYAAMLARGFSGELRTLQVTKITKWDVVFVSLLLGLLVLIQGVVP